MKKNLDLNIKLTKSFCNHLENIIYEACDIVREKSKHLYDFDNCANVNLDEENNRVNIELIYAKGDEETRIFFVLLPNDPQLYKDDKFVVGLYSVLLNEGKAKCNLNDENCFVFKELEKFGERYRIALLEYLKVFGCEAIKIVSDYDFEISLEENFKKLAIETIGLMANLIDKNYEDYNNLEQNRINRIKELCDHNKLDIRPSGYEDSIIFDAYYKALRGELNEAILDLSNLLDERKFSLITLFMMACFFKELGNRNIYEQYRQLFLDYAKKISEDKYSFALYFEKRFGPEKFYKIKTSISDYQTIFYS